MEPVGSPSVATGPSAPTGAVGAVTLIAFLDRSFEAFLCPVHQGVLDDPRVLLCGCSVCRHCVEDLVMRRVSSCPGCQSPIDLRTAMELPPNGIAVRQLRNLPVRCSLGVEFTDPGVWHSCETGCPAIVPWGELEAHERECAWGVVPCPHPDCMEKVQRRQLEDHIQSCPYRLEPCCLGCGATIPHRDMSVHTSRVCPRSRVACPQHCGARLHREKIAAHVTDQCPLTRGPCPNASVGCKEIVPRKDREEHVAICPFGAATIECVSGEGEEEEEEEGTVASGRKTRAGDVKGAVHRLQLSAKQLKRKRNREAIADADEALETFNALAVKALYYKGVAFHRLKQHEHARDAFQQALKLQPSNTLCQRGLEAVEKNLVCDVDDEERKPVDFEPRSTSTRSPKRPVHEQPAEETQHRRRRIRQDLTNLVDDLMKTSPPKALVPDKQGEEIAIIVVDEKQEDEEARDAGHDEEREQEEQRRFSFTFPSFLDPGSGLSAPVGPEPEPEPGPEPEPEPEPEPDEEVEFAQSELAAAVNSEQTLHMGTLSPRTSASGGKQRSYSDLSPDRRGIRSQFADSSNLLTEETIMAFASASLLDAGKICLKRGDVTHLEEDRRAKGRWTALIRSRSQSALYKVSVDLVNRARMCECPTERQLGSCKHIAALLLAIRAETKRTRRQSPDRKRSKEEDPSSGFEGKVTLLKDVLEGLTVERLKEALGYNSQAKSGTKRDLVDRTADRMIHGTLPHCPLCHMNTLTQRGKKFVCRGRKVTGSPGDKHTLPCQYEVDKGSLTRGQWRCPPGSRIEGQIRAILEEM